MSRWGTELAGGGVPPASPPAARGLDRAPPLSHSLREAKRESPEEREAQILALAPLVHALARRYAGRGEPLDDLVQVGMVGLVNAVDRFDPSRGDLARFATPTILGEIRRHFRDRSWGVHVPRRLQEAQALVSRAVEELTGRLGRGPTVDEIAAATELVEEDVLDAMAARAAYRPASLSTPARPDGADPIDVGGPDPGYEQAEGRASLRDDGLRRLPARERVILHLRFEEDLTQSEIAQQVGLSQMHVSRLIQQALERLREHAGEPAAHAPGAPDR
jgi:RNA polymerase sigma-B factor